MNATVEFYDTSDSSEARDWRWRLKAANGEIVASGEGYTKKSDAMRGFGAVIVAVLDVTSVWVMSTKWPS